MSTESEVILARYRAREKEVDKLGRIIHVRRLKPSEQTRLAGMTPELSGFDDVTDPATGARVQVPHRSPLAMAAAVCGIDDVMISFPKTRGELEAVFDRLDIEGLEAATNAVKRLLDHDLSTSPEDQAKNS